MTAQVGDECAAALVAAATEVAARAYAPYSEFHVGAALLGASGRIHAACNVENASYGLSICAERAAVFAAVAAGERNFRAVAVIGVRAGASPISAGGPQPPVDPRRPGGPAPALPGECLPCGACRQVLAEFCGDEAAVFTADAGGVIRRRRLGDLLPEAFRLA